MRPGFSQLNSADGDLAHAKFICKFLLSKLGRTNLFDVRFSKFSARVLFAFFVVCAVSALVHHVFNVLSMGSHREMGWVDTGRVVTRMHDLHSFGDHGLVFKHPRNSVGHVHFASVVDSELSLTAPVLGSRPQPTFIGRSLLDFNPKASLKLFVKHEGNVHEDVASFKVSA